MEDIYHTLFEVFENYLRACRTINNLLLDSRTHGAVADLSHKDFVKEFEESREFEELLKEISNHKIIKELGWEWRPKKSPGGGYIV